MEETQKPRSRIQVHSKLARTFVFGMTMTLGVLSVTQVNASTTKALRLHTLEETNAALAMQNERLQARIGELQSLESVMERERFLALTPVQNISHISLAREMVALR